MHTTKCKAVSIKTFIHAIAQTFTYLGISVVISCVVLYSVSISWQTPNLQRKAMT